MSNGEQNDRNLYAPPAVSEASWDPRKEEAALTAASTGGIKVYGVLSIVFGGLTILSSLAASCSIGLTNNSTMQQLISQGYANPQAIAGAYQQYWDSTYWGTMASSAAFLIMSVALLILGIGQLRRRAWARRLTLWWAGIGLAVLVAQVASALLVAGPASQRLSRALQLAAGSGSVESRVQQVFGAMGGSSAMVVTSIVLYAPYPILLLFYFRRPAVVAAMTR